jgi:hypothetical protein
MLQVKRVIVWFGSLVLGIISTFIMFNLTPIDPIPFIEGGAFTLITVLLMTFFFSIVLDSILKAGVYDETGIHFGPLTPGPVGRNDPKPPADYQPIVSREERRKQEQKQQASSVPAARRH